MKLFEMPIEVLQLIFGLETSYLVLPLWKCGNRMLNQKLAHGGVTQMALISGKKDDEPNCWPRVLKSLRLSVFAFIGTGKIGGIPQIRTDLLALGEHLTYLIFSGDALSMALFGEDNFDTNDASDALQSASKRPKFAEDDSTGLDPTDIAAHHLRCGDLLPKLQRLDCPNTVLTEAQLSLLPRSLMSLSVYCGKFSSLVPYLPNLRHLSGLFLGFDEPTAPLVSLLPSSIETFRTSAMLMLIDCFGGRMLSELKHFPNFDVGSIKLKAKDLSYLLEHEPHFQWSSPSNLNIQWEDLKNEQIAKFFPLPPLVSLTIDALDIAVFQLPKTLKSLTIDKLDWDIFNEASLPNLAELSLTARGALQIEHFQLLPRLLRRLKVGKENSLYGGSRKCVPTEETLIDGTEKLSILSASAVRLLRTIDERRWTNLLDVSKNLPNCAGDYIRTSDENLKAIGAGRHYGLPLYLTSIHIADYDSQELIRDVWIALPPFVTSATLPLSMCTAPSLMRQHCPASICALAIPSSIENDPES